MSNVRFIADTHFGHKNLIENLRNMSVKEHDELIISNWNRVVNKKDIVYILGDFCMESPKLIEYYLSKLSGNIRIIGGNHDTRQCCQVFQSLGIPVLGCLEYKGYIITHIPVHPSEIKRFEKFGQGYRTNIHGHTHSEMIPGYYNVCCECIGYTPRTLQEIEALYNHIVSA